MATNLTRLESDDPHVAGVLMRFDSGLPDKVIQWRAPAGRLIGPALDAAKEYTAAVIQQLIEERREADVRDTNWVSVVAAMHKHIRDFNGKLQFEAVEGARSASTLQ